MRNKANPRLIGLFVLGAIALFALTLVVFGGGLLNRQDQPVVVYFEGSVNGLYVGAPVNFRGVRVGSVSDIELVIDSSDLTARIPVFIRFDRDRATWSNGTGADAKPPEMSFAEMAERGLRAQLTYQSYVTQQLMIELDLLPDTPMRLVRAHPNLEEIPTIPSTLDLVRRNIEELPVQDMIGTAMNTIENLNRLLASPDLARTISSAAAAMSEFETTMAAARETFATGSGTLAEVQGELRTTMAELQGLVSTANREVGPLLESLRNTSRGVEQAVAQAETVLGNTNDLVARNSPVRSDLETAVRNLSLASRSLRGFAETLERNPNALILGRQSR
jgi:paraquat-inducible protein B